MAYEIRKQEVKKQHVVFAEGTGPVDNVPALMGRLLNEVTTKLKPSGADIMPQPFTRYIREENGEVTMWVGFRVRDEIDILGLKSDSLPEGPVLATEHVGPYDRLQEAHEAILDYIAAHKLTRNGEPWELYYTDPNSSEKRDHGRTVVVFPIK